MKFGPNSMSSERNCTRTPYKAFYPRNSSEIVLPVKFEAIFYFAFNSILKAVLMAITMSVTTRLTKQLDFEEKFSTTTKNVNDDKL